ncbi:hypothetical protein CLV30_106107 [Haloactinopolyspora alba]|uniref:Uncharacterized protein n=1 Tax=Haloactinopolyspora alba TaxID=648780 RepID=A0A2P8E3R2_9ACTN|nr:hypothetical protein [Haloactinopolyspora alba]PSL04104.1 hypothetical protein CLV30_106107 [Haloactinopolyspora alba]
MLKWQAVLNEHWPAEPRRFKNREPGIDVRVRVVWEEDGEEFLAGVARRWGDANVYVEVRDTTGRLSSNGVWVKPIDVYRMGDKR